MSDRIQRSGAGRGGSGAVGALVARDLRGDLMSAVLQIRDLTLGYRDLTLFHRLSMDIAAGTTLAVLGANGSGKSTFVKMLLGLMDPLSGSLTWPQGRPGDIGYLAQMTEFDRRFPIRVRDLAAMGAWRGFGYRTGLDAAARDRMAAALDEAGVLDIADRPLHMLSGGQLQRALFARVIMQDAPLILLDEPFAAVDQSTEAHLLSIIRRWRDEGRAVVLVVHDLSSVLDCCSHALLLGGQEATHGPVNDVLTPDRLVAQGYLSESQASWMFRGTHSTAEHANV
ncbi:metal ABC transporter ATP-binding protein [Ruegeria atlantica]|uniref:Putative ABC transporter ATP-binding protein n=1 Tax=Ruegeria atlantica TaxID=81569 RepID=A0A0P1EE71_9RHOB|nr:metal ABC transporter ATP-binding protein [Ruegeria atlantica]CUH47745.1 putative ABC transporter ATP-binding protein [Ruegeria atlantica]